MRSPASAFHFRSLGRRLGAPLVLLIGAGCVPPPAPGAAHILGIPDLCPFHRLTGLPCPGCGMTRALVCLAHGRFQESVGYHPLGIAVFVALAAAAGYRLAGKSVRFSPRTEVVIAAVVGVVFLAAWIARLTHLLPSPP